MSEVEGQDTAGTAKNVVAPHASCIRSDARGSARVPLALDEEVSQTPMSYTELVQAMASLQSALGCSESTFDLSPPRYGSSRGGASYRKNKRAYNGARRSVRAMVHAYEELRTQHEGKVLEANRCIMGSLAFNADVASGGGLEWSSLEGRKNSFCWAPRAQEGGATSTDVYTTPPLSAVVSSAALPVSQAMGDVDALLVSVKEFKVPVDGLGVVIGREDVNTKDPRVPRDAVLVRHDQGDFMVQPLSRVVWVAFSEHSDVARRSGRPLARAAWTRVLAEECVYLMCEKSESETHASELAYPIRFAVACSSTMLLNAPQCAGLLTMAELQAAEDLSDDRDSHTKEVSASMAKNRKGVLRELRRMSRRQASTWDDEAEEKATRCNSSDMEFVKDATGPRWAPLGQPLTSPWTIPTREILANLVSSVEQEETAQR